MICGKIADCRDIFVQLLLRGIVHGKQLCKHPVVLAQQDAAFLHFLEQHFIRRALGVDRCVTEGKLILHPAGEAALPAAVQPRTDAERWKGRCLAVFQFQLGALGPQQVHQ